MGQLSVGVENHGDSFLEISARFFQRRSLRVGSRHLFDKADVPFGHLAKDGRELKLHDSVIRLDSTRGLTEGTFATVDGNSGRDVVYAGALDFDIGLPERLLYRFGVGNQRVYDDGVTTVAAALIYRFP